ncbi:HOT1 (YMR172W) [Zygosaccharomyces parabailii]|nr:HOT1 (YMR172W) [Zygosaccharomyces parabailii]
MSDQSHPLVVASNGGSLLDATQSVGNVGTDPSLNMGTATSNTQRESLPLNLHLGLESDSLTSGQPAAAGASLPPNSTVATNSTSTTSTSMNSNNNTTVPTPVAIPNGNASALESSNPGSTKSTGLGTAYPSMHSIPSASPARTIPSDRSTNTVRMFQRMDELSARFIVMEEMFQKLCKTVEEQSMTIADLKLQNMHSCNEITRKIDELAAQPQRQPREQPSDQDSFVTDLLNSITNVSSSYLRKIRSRSGSKAQLQQYQSGNEQADDRQHQHQNQQQPTNEQNPHWYENSNPQGYGVSTDRTFTLNPNGIKRRKRNMPHSNGTSNAPSYTDLNSLNNFGTISLPNLTLEHTGITPLLRSNAANNLGFPPQPAPTQDSVPKSKGIHLEIGSQLASANEDENEEEDGYQEEDDEDEKSAKTDSSSGSGSDSAGASSAGEQDPSDEEDEAEDDTDAATVASRRAVTDSNARPKRKRKRMIDKNVRSMVGNSDAVTIRSTPDRDERLVLKNSASVPSPRARDLNYTLLKAPSDVRTIWQEYVDGIDGDPPIKKLEEKYGNKWRLNRNRKTFARRKRLYKFILNGMSRGKSADEMIDTLERRRLYRDENGEVKRRTIGWLQQSLTGI